MTDWEHRMGQRHVDEREASRKAELERLRQENPESFSPEEPPGRDGCTACSQWKLENSDIGRYAWWIVCDYFTCPHDECHGGVPVGERFLTAGAPVSGRVVGYHDDQGDEAQQR